MDKSAPPVVRYMQYQAGLIHLYNAYAYLVTNGRQQEWESLQCIEDRIRDVRNAMRALEERLVQWATRRSWWRRLLGWPR